MIFSYIHKKPLNLKEFLILLLCLCIIIGCAAFDYNKLYLVVFKSVCNWQSFIYTVVQVHATLATLGIALLSILTGRFDHKVDGIEITNFIVNKLNTFFTLKNVLLLIMFSVVSSVIFLAFGEYGIVLGLFICSAVLLCFELNKIWLIFNDDAENSLLIKNFLKDKFEGNDDFVIRYLRVPSDTEIASWSTEDVKRYKRNVLELWESILISVKEQCEFDKYCSAYAMSIKGILEKGNNQQKSIAVQYLLDIYYYYNRGKRKFSINIYSEVSFLLYNALPSLDDKSLKDAIIYLPPEVLNSSYNVDSMENGENE